MSSFAFLGATGGCVLQALVLALEDGLTCRALVRTPDKLSKLLTERGVSDSAMSQHLTTLQGNAKEAADIKKLIELPSGGVADFILSGVGGAPKFDNPLYPTLDDPEVCQSTAKAIVQAINELSPASPPRVVAISTTGISKNRDVPYAMFPLYHWILPVPHADKRVMEETLRQCHVDGKIRFSSVRASLLTGGARLGVEKIRVGTDSAPAIGYTISRSDVGGWIYEKILKIGGAEYVGQDLTITY